jgi:glycosyltransferase involved in cell wall biosynthesis
MRILLANEARQGAGGVESYLAALAPALEARGHDVALLYANPSSETGPTRIVTGEAWSVTDEGIDRAMARVRAWRPDVCFSHNMRLLDVDERLVAEQRTFKMMHGYFGACVSGHKAFSFPDLVPCTRVCGPACLVHYLPRRCGRLRPHVMASQYRWARRQQRLFSRYSGIVVASEHMRREYLRYDIPAGHLHRIPLFSTIPAGAAAPTPARAGAEPQIDVVFLGRMTPLKGAEQLVRALPHVASALGRPVRAVLAGSGPERERLRDLARELGGAGGFSVEFPGWIDPAARAAILSRASVAVLPSIWPEPFGLVGLEAAQFGVASVAFDTGGIREWLADGVNGRLVDLAGGAVALGATIAAVLADPSVHARLSAGARAAAARFGIDAHVATLERVLAS